MPPVIKKEKCIGCMNCVTICSADVYGIQKKGAKPPVIAYPNECWHCNACVRECPAKAITLRVPLTQTVVFLEAPDTKTSGEQLHE